MALTDIITAPASIQFTNQSIGDEITRYEWSFGDGSQSTDINPTHVFNTAGNYTVTLIVENATGASIKSHNIIISDVGTGMDSGNGGATGNNTSFNPNTEPIFEEL